MLSPKEISGLYFTKEVMEAVIPRVPGSVLDFGACQGRYKHLFIKRGAIYTSFDLQSGADIVGDILDPPASLLSRQFDTVISNQVLEHVRQPWVLVQNMARLTKKGGLCILTAPFMVPFHPDPGDYFRYTEQGIRSLFEDAGLEVELCTPYGGLFSSLGETLKQKWFSPYTGHPLPHWKRFLRGWMERVCRLLNRVCLPGIVYANVVCIAKKP